MPRFDPTRKEIPLVTVDDFSYGLNLVMSPASIPAGGMFRVTNFHPREHGLERKSGHALVSLGVSEEETGEIGDILTTRGAGVDLNADSDAGVDPDCEVGSRVTYGFSSEAAFLHGAFTRRNPDNQTLQLYIILGVNMFLLKYVAGAWENTKLTDATAATAGNLGRPAVLFDENDAEIPQKYKDDKRVSFAWFRGELWMARRGFPMVRYRPSTNLFYAAPDNAPRPGLLVPFEGFLIGADLGSFSYDDNGATINVPEDPNGMRWCRRFNANQWDDAESISAGFKIPSQCPSRILAACATRDEIVFFHEDEIHTQRYIGGVEIFRTKLVTTRTGIYGRGALACSLDSVLFLGKDNVYFYGGARVVPVDPGRRVRDDIFLIPPAIIAKSVAHYDRRNQEIYWFFPTADPLIYVFNIPKSSWTILAFDNRFLADFPLLFIDLPITPQNNFHFLSKGGRVFDVRPSENTEAGIAFTSSAEFMLDLGTRKTKTLFAIEVTASGTGVLTVGYAWSNNSEWDPTDDYVDGDLKVNAKNRDEVLTVKCAGAVGQYLAIKLSTEAALTIRSFSLRYDTEGRTQGGTG